MKNYEESREKLICFFSSNIFASVCFKSLRWLNAWALCFLSRKFFFLSTFSSSFARVVTGVEFSGSSLNRLKTPKFKIQNGFANKGPF